MVKAHESRILIWSVLLILAGARCAYGQRVRGELRIEVHDLQGAAVAAKAELVSEVNQFRRDFDLPRDGRYIAQGLAFGFYQLHLIAQGFAPWSGGVEIRSEVPVHIVVTLGVAPVNTQIEVSDKSTLLDPSRTGNQFSIGHQALADKVTPQPGRELSDLVDELPGWLYEANGVLHPRGSEYDVQYVVDGVPITENRSPAFAPSLDAGDVESMRVLTGDYPAEYGRKLGGVIEVTNKDAEQGLHGRLDGDGGSFAAAGGSAAISYARARDQIAFSGYGFRSGRYLDPPVLENFTNTGQAGGFSGLYEIDFSERDRVRISLTHDLSRFSVPNYLVQQAAGQHQDMANDETDGQISLQHLISPDLVFSASGSVRDASTVLHSNAFSTPVVVNQERGYREGYTRADLAGHHGRHDWKVGIDSIFNPVSEELQYNITDPTQFDPGTQRQFRFADRGWDFEPSAFAQDQIHAGNWNLSLGLRFDRYGFMVHESAWSPRIGVSRYVHSLNLLLHASYDRVFQTPAIENLLLASSPQVDALNPIVARLPVRPSRGNYYEVGFSKAVVGELRLDASIFRRDFRDFADDDVLLDTGVSFPIAFRSATIIGEELRVEVPRWGRFSGFLSYTNQSGSGQGPITGGLFLGSDALGQLADASRFAISQDQRNTARARVRFQALRQIWFAVGGQYGSGLPADVGDADRGTLVAQYGAAIVYQVNFARGRVRPNLSLEAGAGAEFYHHEHKSAVFQIQLTNFTDRVNVINFESLFSGTAVAVPRSISAHLQFTF